MIYKDNMTFIHYRNNEAYAHGILLKHLADKFGTPCYIYSRPFIEKNYLAFASSLNNIDHLICYAVKANSNVSILKLLNSLGSGFDIVSEGELARALAAGADPKKIIFSGVGKRAEEIEYALNANIYCFNIESENELERVNTIALAQNKIAPIALRINPNIDPKTHPYISTGLKNNKFGIELSRIPGLYERIKNLSNIKLIGIACHIGSQLVETEPFIEVINCLKQVYFQLLNSGAKLEHINVGGGLGVCYQNEIPPTPEQYIALVKHAFSDFPIKIVIEPGRSIIANAGLLLTKVEYVKATTEKNFAIVDAAMNDLMRPSLYNAWHNIVPLKQHSDIVAQNYDIVGPVCESGDFLGHDRTLQLQQDDLLAVLMTGAYGFSMGSNYNSRPRPAEIMLEDNQFYLIRQRETVNDLLRLEQNLT